MKMFNADWDDGPVINVPLISILICSLHSRHEQLTLLLKELLYQRMDNSEVEILTNVDNKEKSTGKKRQELLEEAKGRYVIFVDDDDWPEPCYISELLKAAESGADCFAMNGWITTNGTNKVEWRLSKDYENRTIKENGHRHVYLRKTNHITGVKRELALLAGFPDKSNAEDKAYSDKVAPLCATEYKIKPMMYHYRFSTHNKEYL